MSQADYFAVNFLTEGQETISRRVATKSKDRFQGIGYREGRQHT